MLPAFSFARKTAPEIGPAHRPCESELVHFQHGAKGADEGNQIFSLLVKNTAG